MVAGPPTRILGLMRREEAIGTLRGYLPALRRDFSVRGISLFGSTARDEAREDSDLYILVEFEVIPALDAFVGLKLFLEWMSCQGLPVAGFTKTNSAWSSRGCSERDPPPEYWPSEGVRSLLMREGRDAEGQDAYCGADHSVAGEGDRQSRHR
jgi:predicted nucleotidyltransferase